LVYEPSIILMDEPLGALDRNLRERMQLEIRRLHTELGITLMFVTHDQEEALTLSDRIVLLRNGEIEQQGAPGDLYFRPCTLFAARFLGNSNNLPARLEAVRGGRATVHLQTGAKFDAPVGHDVSVGDDMRVIVRPENVRLTETGAATESGDVKVTGKVMDSIFLAGIIKTYVQLDSGETFISQRLTHRTAQVPEKGSDVGLVWSDADSIILPPDSSIE
jgi:putative spermidine/putrescine transport system ATP-binding protein